MTGLFFGAANLGGWTIGVLAVLAVAFSLFVRQIEKKRDIVRDREEAELAAQSEPAPGTPSATQSSDIAPTS
jgi:PTS system galactitol-specific IIC component